MKIQNRIAGGVLYTSVDEESSSSLDCRGSTETMTLATGREGPSGELERARVTAWGHFKSHIALSALLVSKKSVPVPATELLLVWSFLELQRSMGLSSTSIAECGERGEDEE